MLYLIGLGLSDEKDITVRGLEAVKSSSRVYLEAYTSILGVGKERLVSAGLLPPPDESVLVLPPKLVELMRERGDE